MFLAIFAIQPTSFFSFGFLVTALKPLIHVTHLFAVFVYCCSNITNVCGDVTQISLNRAENNATHDVNQS